MTEPDADPYDPPSDPIAAAVASLGEPLSVHKLGVRRMQLLVLGGFGLVMVGFAVMVAVLLFAGNLGHSLWHFLLMPVVFGLTLLYRVWSTRGLTVMLFPQGILRTGRGSVEAFLWDELKSIRLRADGAKLRGERGADGRWRAVWFEAKVPLLRTWHSWLELTRADGTTLKIMPVIEGYADLLAAVQKVTFAMKWPEVEATFAAGGPVPFGLWALTADSAIAIKKGTVYPTTDWKTAKITGRFLFVNKKSWWRLAFTFDLMTTDNPHLLVAAIDDRIGGGLVTVAPPVVPVGGSAD